jgi:hypothetical protein
MKMKLSHAALFAILSAVSFAETPPAPVIDLEARKASVVNLEAHIAQREERLGDLSKDIITLDARIEKRVAELVKMLAELRDSKDSRSKVSQMKKDAIEGLQRGIEMREKVRTGDETALGDLGKFDERITTRVEQIVELTKSFPTHKDVEKYESDGSSYWNGYYYENTRISEDWRQNRRDNIRTGQQRDDTVEAIRGAIERLDQRRRSLKDLLANRTLTETARKLYVQELGQIDAYTDKLNTEMSDVVTHSGSGGSRQPGLDEAIDIGNLLEDARKDLRGDVSNLFRLYDEFARERSKTAALKENLVARKEWLEKNAAPVSEAPAAN